MIELPPITEFYFHQKYVGNSMTTIIYHSDIIKEILKYVSDKIIIVDRN